MRKCLVLSLVLLLSLASMSSAAYIAGVTARADSEHNASRGPGLVVDGSGMNAEGLHGNSWDTMWLSSSSYDNQRGGTVIGSHWIEFDLKQVYALASMDIWNRSEESWPWFGMKDVTIQYSLTGSTNAADWTTIFAGTIPLSNGPLTPATLNVPFAGVAARYVVITSALGKNLDPSGGDRNWFYDRSAYYENVGLDEVRFYEIPEPISMILLGLGGLTMLRRR